MDALGMAAYSAFSGFRYVRYLEMLDAQHTKKDEELTQTTEEHMRCDRSSPMTNAYFYLVGLCSFV